MRLEKEVTIREEYGSSYIAEINYISEDQDDIIGFYYYTSWYVQTGFFGEKLKEKRWLDTTNKNDVYYL